MATATTKKQQPRYRVQELLLILVAAALVLVTVWYVRHATTAANKNYSIQETNQKAATPKTPATTKAVSQ